MGSLDPRPVQSLLDAAGLGPAWAIVPLGGGANNRVFKVETPGKTVLLKSYFRHPDDPRDRLNAEFSFSQFAWNHGVRCIPQPLVCNPSAGLGLFEYVVGRPLATDEANDAALDQSLAFFRALNRVRSYPAAITLPRASESCFCLDDHFTIVERRVRRLESISVSAMVDAAAAAFIANELAPAWELVAAEARTAAERLEVRSDVPLPTKDRCISPSDFGFHNTILTADGRLRFIDFEYAGWDDPAKVICDFFCQPAVPAPAAAFSRFAGAVAAVFPCAELHLASAALLLPVYRIKWCCILLNEFQSVGISRRSFSGTAAELEARKTVQLAKARAALAAVSLPRSKTRRAA